MHVRRQKARFNFREYCVMMATSGVAEHLENLGVRRGSDRLVRTGTELAHDRAPPEGTIADSTSHS